MVFADLKQFTYEYSYAFPAFFSPKIFINTQLNYTQNPCSSSIIELPVFFLCTSTPNNNNLFDIHPLSYALSKEFNLVSNNFDSFFFGIRNDLFVPCDSESHSFFFGWPIRNYIILICKIFNSKEARILPFSHNELLYQVEYENGIGRIRFSQSNINDCFIHVNCAEFPLSATCNTLPSFPSAFGITGWKTKLNGLVMNFKIDFSKYCDPME